MKQWIERFNKPIYGIGLLIVNKTGQILVIQEKIAKPDSSREINQYSPPLETAKRRGILQEPILQTLLGAMSEVLSDTDLKQDRSSFRRVILPHDTIVPVGSIPLFAKVEVILFNGDSTRQFIPAASDEVATPVWMTPHEFLQREDARSWGKVLVNFASKRGYLQRENLASNKTTVVFPHRLRSIEALNRHRERKNDVPARKSHSLGRIRF